MNLLADSDEEDEDQNGTQDDDLLTSLGMSGSNSGGVGTVFENSDEDDKDDNNWSSQMSHQTSTAGRGWSLSASKFNGSSRPSPNRSSIN